VKGACGRGRKEKSKKKNQVDSLDNGKRGLQDHSGTGGEGALKKFWRRRGKIGQASVNEKRRKKRQRLRTSHAGDKENLRRENERWK